MSTLLLDNNFGVLPVSGAGTRVCTDTKNTLTWAADDITGTLAALIAEGMAQAVTIAGG